MPTVVAIVGNKLAPWLGDWYLARTGFRSQQTDERRDPDQPDNLWRPVDEGRDFGAHGVFDARAKPSSLQLWATEHRAALAAAVALAAAGLGALVRQISRRR
jgi:hypothetical protein